MKLTINGEAREFDGERLSELLRSLGLGGRPVVVELDHEPVLPGDYETTSLHDGAELEIVTLAAGG